MGTLDKIADGSGRRRRVTGTAWFVVVFGWVAIFLALFFQWYGNVQRRSPVQGAPFSYHEEFDGQLGPHLWQSEPVAVLALTCLYPDSWFTIKGLMTLPLVKKDSLCFGKRRPYRGSLTCTKMRFRPPFRVQARMQTSNGPGVISALYTYTDPTDGNPHFENDFEFPSAGYPHIAIWINRYSPDNKNPELGDPHFKVLKLDTSSSLNDYSIEVYKNKSVFRLNGQFLEDRALVTREAEPQKVCFNAWFARSWPNFYSGLEYHENFEQFKVVKVDITSLDGAAAVPPSVESVAPTFVTPPDVDVNPAEPDELHR